MTEEAPGGSSSRAVALVGPTGSRVIIQQSSGSRLGNAIGPFDQAHAGAVPVVGDTELFKGEGTRQPVRVEVVDRNAPLVFVDQDERRAGDRARIDLESFGDRAHQPRLAGPQRTDQADHDARSDQVREQRAQQDGIVLRRQIDRKTVRKLGHIHGQSRHRTFAEMVETARLDRMNRPIAGVQPHAGGARDLRRSDGA